MAKLYSFFSNKRFLLPLFSILFSAYGSPVVAGAYYEDFNALSTLPEGWWVDGSASVYEVGTDRDYSNRDGNKYRSLYAVDANESAVVVTPRLGGTVSFYVRAYGNKRVASVQVFEYTKEGDTYTRGQLLTSKSWPSNNTDVSWGIITQECGANGKYLGILLSKACLDNFSAENLMEEDSQGGGVEDEQPVETKKALKITSFTLTSPYSVEADENNKYSAMFEATVLNCGNVGLAPEEVVVSLLNVSNGVLLTAHATDSLFADSVCVIPLSLTADAGDGGTITHYVREEITGTMAAYDNGVLVGRGVMVTAYKPTFSISEVGGYRVDNDENFDFGFTKTPVSKQFSVKNDGIAPLTVVMKMPEDFTVSNDSFVVAANSADTFAVTLAPVAGEYGQKTGVVVLRHTVGSFSFNVSGFTVNPELFFADFSEFPSAWEVGESWTLSGGAARQQSFTDEATRLVTQKLSVAEGETLSLQAKRNYAKTPAVLNVYYSPSKDEGSWTLAQSLGSSIPSSVYETLTVSDIPSGNYYLAFEGLGVTIDNVVGYREASDEPVLALLDDADRQLSAGDTISFGTTLKDTTVTYYICNAGTGMLKAALQTTDGYLVEPAMIELPAGERQQLSITLVAEPYGEKPGTLSVKGEGMDEFIISLSGLSRDSLIVFFDFQDQQLPMGWQTEGRWSVMREDFSSDNYEIENIDYSGTVASLTMRPMTVEEGDALIFDVRSYDNAGYQPALRVTYSADSLQWKEAADLTEQLSATFTTVHIDTIPAGTYYIRFEGVNVLIDNITGLHVADDVTLVPARLVYNVMDDTAKQAAFTLGGFRSSGLRSRVITVVNGKKIVKK